MTRAAAHLAVALLAAALLAPPAAAGAAVSRPVVAVLYFDYGGERKDLGVLRKGLAQMLISDLAALDAIELVERNRLEAVSDELARARSGGMDRRSTARLGKLLGARYLVLGDYFDLMGTLRIDARLVEVETGRVVQSVGAQGTEADFLSVQRTVADALLGALRAEPLPRPPKAKRRPRPKRKPKEGTGASSPAPQPAPPPSRPKILELATAVRYAEALDAQDRGDAAAARGGLEAVLAKQPDFGLAAADLARLIQ